MVFICGKLFDEEREPRVIADGVVSADIQRDYDIIWNECQDVCEVL